MNHIVSTLQEIKELELHEHVETDDVITKVTEEVCELLEAFWNLDPEEMNKEAKDVVTNVLSASYACNALPDVFSLPKDDETLPFPDEKIMLSHLSKWLETIGALRNRFSRKERTPEDLALATKNLVEATLNYGYKGNTVESMLEDNLEKFRSRKGLYKPKIALHDYIKTYEDFPKTGISFRDISPILANSKVLRYTAFEMANHCQKADVIVGLDSRGFLLGTLIANILEKPFVMLRKAGKLPGECSKESYCLEYGEATLEIQNGSISPGQRVAIVDDLLATGGTLLAAANLVEKLWGIVEVASTIIALNEAELANLPGRKNLEEKYRVLSLLQD